MSKLKNYYVKQQIKITAEIRNEAGALTSPTKLICKIKNPKGETTEFTLAKGEVTEESTGKLYLFYKLEEAGLYHVRWEATGNITSASEEYVRALVTEFY